MIQIFLLLVLCAMIVHGDDWDTEFQQTTSGPKFQGLQYKNVLGSNGLYYKLLSAENTTFLRNLELTDNLFDLIYSHYANTIPTDPRVMKLGRWLSERDRQGGSHIAELPMDRFPRGGAMTFEQFMFLKGDYLTDPDLPNRYGPALHELGHLTCATGNCQSIGNGGHPSGFCRAQALWFIGAKTLGFWDSTPDMKWAKSIENMLQASYTGGNITDCLKLGRA